LVALSIILGDVDYAEGFFNDTRFYLFVKGGIAVEAWGEVYLE